MLDDAMTVYCSGVAKVPTITSLSFGYEGDGTGRYANHNHKSWEEMYVCVVGEGRRQQCNRGSSLPWLLPILAYLAQLR